MSDETKTEEEPSIEEILDSIRQIISEDDEEGDDDLAAENPVEEAAAEEEPDLGPVDEPMDKADTSAAELGTDVEEPLDQSGTDDIDFDASSTESEPLELTEKIATGDDMLEIDMIDSDESEDVSVQVDGDVAIEPEPEAVEEPEVEVVEKEQDAISEPEPRQEPESTPESVPHEETADDILTDQAKEAAFTAMSELVRKTAVDHSSTITIEDIVRSELKPLLRGWLDEHLPTVIDRLVREELERVSKRVLED